MKYQADRMPSHTRCSLGSRLLRASSFVASLAMVSASLAGSGNAPSYSVLTVAGGPGNYSLTATVGGTALPTPTGGVTFVDTTNSAVLGTFQLSAPTLGFTGSSFSTGQSPSAIVLQDFNGDGKTDLAIANTNDNTVSIFLGNGDGTFSPASNPAVSVGNAPWAIVAADFNGDGKQDLAVANVGDGTVTILLGNGDGTFAPAPSSPVTVGTFPVSLAANDFNGDGIADLVVANSADSTLTVLLGNGDGSFTPTPSSPFAVGSTPYSLAAADLNGDTKIDLVVANKDDYTFSVLLGNGDGTFTTATGSPVIVGSSPSNLILVDLNGDQKPDLVVVNSGDNTLSILLGAGNGTFTAAPGSPITVGDNPQWVIAGDLNGDGYEDLAVANANDNTVTVLVGAGNGTFSQAPFSPLAVGNSPLCIQVANFNGAQKLDMVVVNAGDNTVGILLSGQLASATLANLALPGTGLQQVQANYAGDSTYSPGSSNQFQLLGSGLVLTGTTLSSSSNPSAVGQSITLAATVTPASGSVVPTGSFTFLDGANQIGTGTLSSQAQATFTTSTLSQGVHSITAQYRGDSNFFTSTSAALMQTVNAAPKVMLTPAGPLTFGAVTVGTAAAQTVTVTNMGSAAMSFTNIAVSGRGFFLGPLMEPVAVEHVAADRGIVDHVVVGPTPVEPLPTGTMCPTGTGSLAVGASCVLRITFMPQVAGTVSGQVTITDDAASSPQTIAVSGTGVSRTSPLTEPPRFR
jgi:hypothetical protein